MSMASSGKLYCLKRITQLLLSVSVVSLLFSQYSSLVPLLLESYDHILSNYSIKLFTYKSERNYIFLLCNGILVLIIQTSGLISKITPVQSNPTVAAVKSSVKHDQTATVKPKINEIPKKVEVFEEEEKGGDDVSIGDHNEEEDHENIILVDVQEDNNQVEDGKDDDDDDEGIDHELNRKCEDFIKKMKQEIMGA